MRKNDLVERLASRTNTTPGAAADQLDQIVHRIIQSLKDGKPAALPGLGTFTPANSKSGFRFQAQVKKLQRNRTKR